MGKEMSVEIHRPRIYTIKESGSVPIVNGRLKTADRMMSNDNGVYRANWSDALAILPRPIDEQTAFIDWVANKKFNGIRIFCGVLVWSKPVPQTIELVYERLPFILEYAAEKGLYVEVTAITDSATGYDVEMHIREVINIVKWRDNSIIELANEPYHSTQSDFVHDPRYLASLGRLVPDDILYALGAAPDDESVAYMIGGHYGTLHLDRHRDKWNMVRRVRELENISNSTNKHVFNNEPIKFGSQMADPAIAFCMAALNRGFEVGGIFHFDDGLNAVVPTEQNVLADAWMEGFNTFQTTARMKFQNATWPDSPVAGADWDHSIIRAYSFLSDDVDVLVEVGVIEDGKIVFKNGYSRDILLGEMQDTEHIRSCRVWKLKKG